MLTLTKAIGVLLAPPGIVIILGVLGLLLQLRWRVLGITVTALSLGALLALSLPVTGHFLMNTLEDSVDPIRSADETLRTQADVIVVLGGGRVTDAPEYGGDTVSEFTLERLRYAARLHRASGLPLLVTGGSVFGEAISEGDLMQRVLIDDFRVRATWVEARSRTTYENAVYSRAILEAAGVRRVVLVTHAWHMPRAAWSFRQTGLEILPAPISYSGGNIRARVLDLVPSGHGLALSNRALHEWLGLFWYRLAYRSASAPTGSFAAPAAPG